MEVNDSHGFVLPEGWVLENLGSLFEFQNGVNAEKSAYGAGLRFVNVLEVITNNRLLAADIPGRVRLSPENASAFRVKTRDLLFNRSSETQDEVGMASVYLGAEHVVFGGFVIRGRPRDDRLHPELAASLLRAPAARAQIAARGQGAVRANIAQSDLAGVVIPIPPKDEQDAIAGALSDADALIESLSLLLAKKRQIKQGVMQQLLTGKRRLPGFSSDWRLTELAQVGQWIGGMTPAMSNAAYWSPAEVPWLSSGDIKKMHITSSAASVSLHAVKSGATKLAAEGSVVVVMRSGILRKFFPVALTTRPMAINQDLKALLPNRDVSAEFLLHALTYEGPRILSTCLKSGTTVESVELGWLKRTQILLPPQGEQQAIAQVLSNMDAEIAMIESRVSKARDVKQGMMQSLLTGRIRIVQPNSNVIPLPTKSAATKPPSTQPTHNWQINEAVVIAVLAQRFGNEQFPLPRKRRVKLTYLLHRHAEGRAEGYLKKAAGPYDPNTKYKGPEQIALKNGYVRALRNEKYEGFVAGDKIEQAQRYFEQWYGEAALAWLERFHYRKTDDLELLATVDMAMVDLAANGEPADVTSVKRVITAHPEWLPKLSRELFSDERIAIAIAECQTLFGG